MKKILFILIAVTTFCVVASSCSFQSKEEKFISLMNQLTTIAEDLDADEEDITTSLKRLEKDYRSLEKYEIEDYRFTKKQKKELEKLQMRLALAMMLNNKFQAIMLKMAIEDELGGLNLVLKN